MAFHSCGNVATLLIAKGCSNLTFEKFCQLRVFRRENMLLPCVHYKLKQQEQLLTSSQVVTEWILLGFA